jgi:hypothetical protein
MPLALVPCAQLQSSSIPVTAMMQIHQSGTPKCDNITTKEEAQNYYILIDRELMCMWVCI